MENNGFENNNSQNSGFENNNSQNNGFENSNSQNSGFENNNSQNNGLENSNSQNNGFENSNSQNSGFENSNSQNNVFENNNSQNNVFENNGYQNGGYQSSGYQNNYTDGSVDRNNGKRSGGSGRNNFATVLLCIILSAVMGFIGGYVGSMNNGDTVILDADTTPSATVTETASQTPAVSDGSIYTEGQAENIDTKTIAQVAAEVADTVVEITTETVITGNRLQQYVSTGAGSGVIFREDGYIVTNNHVIDGAGKISVTMKNGNVYEAQLIGTDSQTDLAVLKIDAQDLKIAQFGDSSALIVGQTAIAIGNPLGSLGGTVTDGIISALDREITVDNEVMNLLQTNAAVNPGNSGGGLFDAKGLLVGVVNAKSSGDDVEGLGFAIPINTVKTIISDLVQYGYVRGRVDSGMSLIQITDSITAMQYRVSYYGLYVYTIREDSNAYRAGLRTGDYIETVNGAEITTLVEFNKILKNLSVGDTLEISVLRSRNSYQYSFVLEEYKVKGFAS